MDEDTDYEESNDDTEDEKSPQSSPQNNAEDEEVEEDKEKVLEECMSLFQRTDFIMEADIISTLKKFFSASGNPFTVIDILCKNYSAVAQTGNLLAEMMCLSGMSLESVQSLIEDHLQSMVISHFDPVMADGIFKDESGTPDWLTDMIDHPCWRCLVYKLAEDFPDCLMLSFAIKLISDAGHQGEITCISTASQQLEVFARIMKTFVHNFLTGGQEVNLHDLTKMVCHSEHTLLYSSALLDILSSESSGGLNIKRLFQEIHKSALKAGHDASAVVMALNAANDYPKVCMALSAMLKKNSLNPADVSVLAKAYSGEDQTVVPPVELLRIPQLLDLLVDALFRPSSSRIHPQHKPKYIFLLAYACCVYEKKGKKESPNKREKREPNTDELKQTISVIEKVSEICTEKKISSNELLTELSTLYQCMKMSPVVSLGILRWVQDTVLQDHYFQLSTEHTPLHLALIDEVTACHPTLHAQVLDLLVQLFQTQFLDLDVSLYMEIKKMLLDRMVHLLSKGYVMPVINYIKTCLQKQETDVSFIRYFVVEVLDVISPPYTKLFVDNFQELVTDPEVTGSLTERESNLVNTFLNHCKNMT